MVFVTASALLPDLLTISDIRALTQLGRDAAYGLLESGDLRGFKIGNTWRVERGEYEAWKRRKSGQAHAPTVLPFRLSTPNRGQKAAKP